MASIEMTPAAKALLARADTEFDVSKSDMIRVGARHGLGFTATVFVLEQMIQAGYLVEVGYDYALTLEGARAADIVLE